MKSTSIYFQDGEVRIRLRSLLPAIRTARSGGLRFDRRLVDDQDWQSASCDWDQYALAKGVSHLEQGLSCFAFSPDMVHGLHHRLADDFPGISLDRFPLCYDDRQMVSGFGGFIRWVYFVNPVGQDDVIGLDFNLAPPPPSGVVRSVYQAMESFRLLAWHGLALATRAVLLNHHLCWSNGIRQMQEQNSLLTVGDWLSRGPLLFGPAGIQCPRCGQSTRSDYRSSYCRQCGAAFNRFILKEDDHGLVAEARLDWATSRAL